MNGVAKGSHTDRTLSTYRENTITANGFTVTGGVNQGSNYCDGPNSPSATCPQVGPRPLPPPDVGIGPETHEATGSGRRRGDPR